MSKTMHTPGPWDWFTRSSDGSKDRQGDVCMRFLVGSNDQGFAHTVGLDHEQDEANARLIAAAPELLEALTFLTGHCRRMGFDTREEEPLLQAAEAAIAKATS